MGGHCFDGNRRSWEFFGIWFRSGFYCFSLGSCGLDIKLRYCTNYAEGAFPVAGLLGSGDRCGWSSYCRVERKATGAEVRSSRDLGCYHNYRVRSLHGYHYHFDWWLDVREPEVWQKDNTDRLGACWVIWYLCRKELGCTNY